MASIGIEGMVFHARHGFFPEEQVLGGRYEISVYLEADLAPAAESGKLRDTIDYGEVYKIVAAEMTVVYQLIETLAKHIADGILAAFTVLEEVKVRVTKFAPPIGGLCTAAYVEWISRRP